MSQPKEPKKATRRPGQPTKYREEYCQAIVESAKKGETFDIFAGDLEVHIDTVHEWTKKHPEFSEAKKVARQIQRSLFNKMFITAMLGQKKGIQPAMMIFWAKAQFGFREEPEIETDPIDEIEFT